MAQLSLQRGRVKRGRRVGGGVCEGAIWVAGNPFWAFGLKLDATLIDERGKWEKSTKV